MDTEKQEEFPKVEWAIVVQCIKEGENPPIYKIVMKYYGDAPTPKCESDQNWMDQGRVIVDLLIVLDMVLLTMIVIKCILTVLTVDALLLIYLLVSWYVICIEEGDDLDM